MPGPEREERNGYSLLFKIITIEKEISNTTR